MRSPSRLVLAAAMLGAALNMAPAANSLAVRRNDDAPKLSLLDGILPRGLRVGGQPEARYIKRPLWTTAQDKRRARKARNIRRHKLAIKRRGRR